ncbi:malate synthase [Brevibacterium sanguinis]|uniref:Malate synthase n=2 Tax=Brevibacterium TaxID=1696 RepID=A0A366IIG0_9MICO|nr:MULTISPECIES: malate synthase [Brevibacterium]RBP62223.1 malate synthase [Brevibacterium sanguinis]RBP70645.1 malate synthase [Brevibacterium celere]
MSHIRVNAPIEPGFDTVLTAPALDFVAALHDRFARPLDSLLEKRRARAAAMDGGTLPRFAAETARIRTDLSWQVAGSVGAPGLEDRRVELVGPVTDADAVAALNSRASVWIADFEDSTSPTWSNVIGGQLTLMDAVHGRLAGVDNPTPPTIGMRPRGWHLPEKHLTVVDGEGRESDASGALVDFGLGFFHNARRLVDTGSGPYFWLPKIESALEARLWNRIFEFAQESLGLERGTIRATVHIETITATFQMEEILWELREHCAGLQSAGWDYLFSVVKSFRNLPQFILPDRERLTNALPLMRAFTDRLVWTCHRRGAHAIGTMSNLMRHHPDADHVAAEFERMREDKAREAWQGFDGTWVADPGLVPDALAVYDAALGERSHQLDNLRPDVTVCAEHLLDLTGLEPIVTEAGVRINIRVAIGYIDEWLGGRGQVALENLLEDVSTAEICRSQIWQWIRHEVRLDNGRQVTRELIQEYLDDELTRMGRRPDDHLAEAVEVFRRCTLGEEFPEFLTMPVYSEHLVERDTSRSPAKAAIAAA